MRNFEGRIAALENKHSKLPAVFHIMCKVEEPNNDEQAQIDEAERRGMFVICQVIVAPKKRAS